MSMQGAKIRRILQSIVLRSIFVCFALTTLTCAHLSKVYSFLPVKLSLRLTKELRQVGILQVVSSTLCI